MGDRKMDEEDEIDSLNSIFLSHIFIKDCLGTPGKPSSASDMIIGLEL